MSRGHQDERFLKLSYDRKVAPRGLYQASRDRWLPTVGNSFGLPSGESCPGRTEFCESCYAVGSEQSAGVRQLVEHNLRLLTAAGGRPGMIRLLLEMLGRYRTEADRARLNPEERIFRIHWDGDFFSVEYAEAWAKAMGAFPEVRFWAYTRSFRAPVDVVPVLAPVPNLALYLSVDWWNAGDAFDQAERWPVHLALCGVDYVTARALAGDDPTRASVCPENAGRMPLMAEGRGACVDCGLCVTGRRDVIFSTSHRENIDIEIPLTGPSAGVCGAPDCHNPLPVSGRGRPRVYCQRACQVRAWRAQKVAS